MNKRSETYIVLQGQEVIHASVLTGDEVRALVPGLERGAQIWRVTPEEVCRNMVEDFVREAYEAGAIDREHALVCELLRLPRSLEEHQGNRADDEYHSGEFA